MRSRFVHVLGFLIALFCLLALLSQFLLPKNNRPQDQVYYSNASGILSEADNTVDAVFLGDSEALCAFIPFQIWQEHGISTYICSSLDQRLYETEELLHMIFENQQPKIIVLETNVLYRDYPRTETLSAGIQRAIPVFRYHDRWKSTDFSEFFAPVHYTHRNSTKGFRLDVSIKPANTEHYMEYTDASYPCPPQNIPLLKRMHAYCQEQGAQLVLLSSPSPLNWSWMMFNYLAPIAEELGVPLIDTNQMQDLIPIDWTTDTPDYGDHLNFFGATKLSKFVGSYLADTGLFADKRNLPEYAIWNTEAEAFFAEAANMIANADNE